MNPTVILQSSNFSRYLGLIFIAFIVLNLMSIAFGGAIQVDEVGDVIMEEAYDEVSQTGFDLNDVPEIPSVELKLGLE